MAQVNSIQAKKFVSGTNYPASKGEIVPHAEGQGADDNVLSVLFRSPDRQYDGPSIVSHEISEAQ